MATEHRAATSSSSSRGEPKKPTDLPKKAYRDVLRRVRQQIKHDNLTDRAAALTYYGVLALFPALLVLVAGVGLLGHSTTQTILDNLGQVAPGGVKTFLAQVIKQAQSRGTAGVAGIIGVLVAFWSASGYIAAFMRSANAIYNIDEGRPIWKKIPVRLGVTVAIGVLIAASALMVVVTGRIAEQVGRALGIGHGGVVVWDILKWPVLLVLVSLMISLLYWACPNVKQPGFRWITPGGVLAVLIWIVASGAFAVYVAFSGSYNKTYGSLATVIIFLVWLWITNLAILIGAEFNAETEHQRAIEAGLPADVEPYVELRDTKKLDDEEKEKVAAADRASRRHANPRHGDPRRHRSDG
jgi:membrane protein